MFKDEEYQRDVLEVNDIKNILGIGINQAYKLVHSGEFHVVRVGRKIKIPKEAFYKWLNGQGNQ